VPMRTPGRMTAFKPIQTWPSMTTGCDSGNSVCVTTSVLAVGPHEVLCPRWRCPGLHEAHRRADDKRSSARLLAAGGQRALAQEIELVFLEAALQPQETAGPCRASAHRPFPGRPARSRPRHLDQLPVPAVAGDGRCSCWSKASALVSWIS
jgi:hypothetical protein